MEPCGKVETGQSGDIGGKWKDTWESGKIGGSGAKGESRDRGKW